MWWLLDVIGLAMGFPFLSRTVSTQKGLSEMAASTSRWAACRPWLASSLPRYPSLHSRHRACRWEGRGSHSSRWPQKNTIQLFGSKPSFFGDTIRWACLDRENYITDYLIYIISMWCVLLVFSSFSPAARYDVVQKIGLHLGQCWEDIKQEHHTWMVWDSTFKGPVPVKFEDFQDPSSTCAALNWFIPNTISFSQVSQQLLNLSS